MFKFIADSGDTLNVVWKIRFKAQFLTQLTYMIMNGFSRIEITILFPNQILLMFVKDFFLKVAQKKGRTKRTHQIAGFETMM